MCRWTDADYRRATVDRRSVTSIAADACAKAADVRAAQNAPNLQRPVARMQEVNLHRTLSVFIFDWDDTLFPTSALTAMGPDRLGSAFEQIDAQVYQLLSSAASVPQSRVVILTNANIRWVYQSTEQFLPKVSKLLLDPEGSITIVSAHRPKECLPEVGSAAYIAEVSTWKRQALPPLVHAFQEAISELQAGAVQVISVGDMPHDLEAAHALSSMLVMSSKESYVKTVLMKPRPTPPELSAQLRCLGKALPVFVRAARSFHQSMCQARPTEPCTVKPATVRATSPFARREAPAPAASTTEVLHASISEPSVVSEPLVVDAHDADMRPATALVEAESLASHESLNVENARPEEKETVQSNDAHAERKPRLHRNRIRSRKQRAQ